MKFVCIESTLDITFPDKVVRIWINRDQFRSHYTINDALARQIQSAVKIGITDYDLFTAVNKNFPDVSAMQIIGQSKDGVAHGLVIYFHDFNVDIHG